MRFRELRIAWSVFWGLAAVLLIVLWVRSYITWNDEISYVISSSRSWHLASAEGGVSFCTAKHSIANPGAWRMYTAWERGVLGFGAFATTSSTSFRIPYWFPVTVLIAFGAGPWLRWRFTLRTLLIATMLVAVGLGLIVWLR